MVELKFFKVEVLPHDPKPNAWYLLMHDKYCETFVTDSVGTYKMVGNTTMILDVISEATDIPGNNPFIINCVAGETVSGGSVVTIKEDGRV